MLHYIVRFSGKMKLCKYHILTFVVLFCIPAAHGWGVDGHLIICKLAQSRLSKAAEDAVSELLPAYAENDLSSVCSWADRIKFRYHWSSPLHFLNTPDNLCTYQYKRDCKDEYGVKDRCVAGAINNYTSQLLSYRDSSSQYNLTEALMFLSHFIGDIHQPLHVGFTSDKGGNTIDVHWYGRKTVLHHVWDTNIIETAEARFYDSAVDELIDALQKNITTVWSNQAKAWEACSQTACPDQYASEGIKAACDWAYKGVEEDSMATFCRGGQSSICDWLREESAWQPHLTVYSDDHIPTLSLTKDFDETLDNFWNQRKQLNCYHRSFEDFPNNGRLWSSASTEV